MAILPADSWADRGTRSMGAVDAGALDSHPAAPATSVASAAPRAAF